MKAGIATIRKELSGIYNNQEIESVIALIFNKLKGYSRTQLILAKDEPLTDLERSKLGDIISRLKKHEPIQYVLGSTEFYGLSFLCAPGVLIPRPETEELVDWIIRENTTLRPTIVDIGTGTGCIAIALQKNIPESHVMACDISPVCLETAARNAKLNKSDIALFQYDIINNVPAADFPELDIVVSNPPYVRESEKLLMEKNVTDFEPELALFVPDENPLIFYEQIAGFARLNLKNGGKLYFEINELFGEECCNMLIEKGFVQVELKKDINGKDRMIRSINRRD
ncbi:MAG TPA: peptide chain release factor N(5)-glutamine methyltransferase [Prolixibacteraceae bacterium]|nr:peptide chain release factor N(5)-glutamine methyltransferase [Prolixibacteraceae bacterium]